MVSNELKKNKQIKRIELVFLLWFITLPFGSIIGGISIGFMTLYPSLVIGVVLFILVIPSIKEWKRSIQLFFLLLLVWLIYASSWFLWNSTYEDWKIDIKSLFLQFIYAGILFGSYYILGVKQFKVILIKGLTFFLSIIIIIGILEYSTGVHLLGAYTDKLLTHEVVTDVFYAPIFIYDNPNNYLVYFIGLTTLYFSLVVKKTQVSLENIDGFIIRIYFLFCCRISNYNGHLCRPYFNSVI